MSESDASFWYVLLFFTQEAVKQSVVIFRHHKAEAYIFLVQKRKGRTVADHHAFFDGAFK